MLKLKKMVSMQAHKAKRLDIQNDATIGSYGQSPTHTTFSGHKTLMGKAKPKVAEMPDGSHMATNSSADIAMMATHDHAMKTAKRVPSPSRSMPGHGGRKSTIGRRIY